MSHQRSLNTNQSGSVINKKVANLPSTKLTTNSSSSAMISKSPNRGSTTLYKEVSTASVKQPKSSLHQATSALPKTHTTSSTKPFGTNAASPATAALIELDRVTKTSEKNNLCNATLSSQKPIKPLASAPLHVAPSAIAKQIQLKPKQKLTSGQNTVSKSSPIKKNLNTQRDVVPPTAAANKSSTSGFAHHSPSTNLLSSIGKS
ncbi:unnamed protein product, partial [Protopolystoma xenopodis]